MDARRELTAEKPELTYRLVDHPQRAFNGATFSGAAEFKRATFSGDAGFMSVAMRKSPCVARSKSPFVAS